MSTDVKNLKNVSDMSNYFLGKHKSVNGNGTYGASPGEIESRVIGILKEIDKDASNCVRTLFAATIERLLGGNSYDVYVGCSILSSLNYYIASRNNSYGIDVAALNKMAIEDIRRIESGKYKDESVVSPDYKTQLSDMKASSSMFGIANKDINMVVSKYDSF